MALNADLQILTQPGSTGNQTYNVGGGFAPKAVILWATPLAADGTAAHMAIGMGVATYRSSTVSQRYISMRGLDNAASADLAMGQGNDAALVLLTNSAGASSRDLEIELVSMDDDEVVLNWVNLHTTASIRVFMLVLGGSDITDALVADFSAGTGSTTQDVTVVSGFGKPDLLFFLGSGEFGFTGANDFAVDISSFSFGFARQGEAGRMVEFSQDDGNTASVVGMRQRENRFGAQHQWGGADLTLARLDTTAANWPTDGFRVLYDANPIFASAFAYLALRGTFQSASGANTAVTAGSPPVDQDNALGFAGKAALVFGWNLAASASVNSSDAALGAFGIGAYDGTTQGWAGISEDDAAGTMDSNSQQDDSHILLNYNQAAALQSSAVASFSGNNLRLSWDDLDGTARQYQYLALGDAAGAGTQDIQPTGFADGATFGTATVGRGAVTVAPTGFQDGATFGTAIVGSGAVVQPTGFADAATFGTAVVGRGAVTVAPTGFADGATFGTAAVTATSGLSPMPIVSRGLPAYDSGDGTYPGSRANDADELTAWRSLYTPGTGTSTGNGSHQWVAYDISSLGDAREAIVAHWSNDATGEYYKTEAQGHASYYLQPRDYSIQGHAASGGGSPPSATDGGWTNLITPVTGNTFNNRAHDLGDIAAYNWIRLRVTAANGASPNDDVSVQFDLHDARLGKQDWFLMLGDSITQEYTGRHNIDGSNWDDGSIAWQVNDAQSDRYPLVQPGGNGGMTMDWAATNIATLIAPSAARYAVVLYGTNDASGSVSAANFRADLDVVVAALQAAGKIVILPTILKRSSGTPNGFVVQYNAEIADAIADDPTILAGPDFYAAVDDGTIALRDGIHPTYDGTPSGYEAMIAIMATWLAALEGETGQEVTPSGFADTATFGTATIGRGAVSVAPAGFADGQVFGQASIGRGVVTIAPVGFQDAATFGTAVVGLGGRVLAPQGFADQATFGTAVIGRGAVTIAALGFADAATFGQATIVGGVQHPPIPNPSGAWGGDGRRGAWSGDKKGRWG